MPKRKRETSLSDLTDGEIENLWASKTLGGSSPESILNTLYFNNTVHFGVCDRNRHREIKWGDVELKEDSDGQEYIVLKKQISQTNQGEQSDSNHSLPKMCSLPEKERCPVEMYKKYKSLRPENYCSQDSPFYVATNVNYSSKGSVWFKKQPVGVNKLEDIMKRLLNNQLSSPPNRVPDQKRTLKRRGSKARKDSDVNPEASSSKNSTFGSTKDNSPELNPLNEDADDMDLLTTAAKSVGWLGRTGTGFRVGSKYIMTASHVIKMALDGVETFEPMTLERLQTLIDKQGVSIHFKHRGDPSPVLLGKVVFFEDCKETSLLEIDDSFLDVTIAELKPSTGYTLPDPLINFYDDFRKDKNNQCTQKNLNLIGHNGGTEKLKIGRAMTIISGSMIKEMVNEFDKISRGEAIKHKILHRVGTDPKRVQFKGTFRWGGSGCPGFVIKDGQAKVFTILTHGFFHTFDNVPVKLHIQEGPRMWHIKDSLKSQNPDVCKDIFGDWDTSNDEESTMDTT